MFSHGKDAGPWGVKITALAGNARSEGYEVESVDYRGIDDPRERVNKLVEFCKELKGDLVLVRLEPRAATCPWPPRRCCMRAACSSWRRR